jgi:hypothetical protein
MPLQTSTEKCIWRAREGIKHRYQVHSFVKVLYTVHLISFAQPTYLHQCQQLLLASGGQWPPAHVQSPLPA